MAPPTPAGLFVYDRMNVIQRNGRSCRGVPAAVVSACLTMNIMESASYRELNTNVFGGGDNDAGMKVPWMIPTTTPFREKVAPIGQETGALSTESAIDAAQPKSSSPRTERLRR